MGKEYVMRGLGFIDGKGVRASVNLPTYQKEYVMIRLDDIDEEGVTIKHVNLPTCQWHRYPILNSSLQ